MVRLSNEATVQFFGSAIYGIFSIQRLMTEMVPINAPKENCLYAIWHANLLSVHCLKDNNNGPLNISFTVVRCSYNFNTPFLGNFSYNFTISRMGY